MSSTESARFIINSDRIAIPIDGVTMELGESLGKGPMRKVTFTDGVVYSALPMNSFTWTAKLLAGIDAHSGYVHVRKKRKTSGWVVDVTAFVGDMSLGKHYQCMHPVKPAPVAAEPWDWGGLPYDDYVFPSRDEAFLAGMFCLRHGQDRLGVTPIVGEYPQTAEDVIAEAQRYYDAWVEARP